MQRFWRTIALSIVVGAFVSLEYVIWFTLHLPFGIDAVNLEVNRALVPWQLIIRITLTVIFVWTVLSTYSFLLMSFPHSEAFWGFFMVILHEKKPKEHPSSPLFEKNNLIIALS